MIPVMSVPMLLVEKEKKVLIAFTSPRGKSVFTLLRQCSVKIHSRSLTYLTLDIEKQYICTLFCVIAVNNERRPIVYSEPATFVLLIKWCKMNGSELNIRERYAVFQT